MTDSLFDGWAGNRPEAAYFGPSLPQYPPQEPVSILELAELVQREDEEWDEWEGVLQGITTVGTELRALNDIRMDVWVEIHELLYHAMGTVLTDSLLIDRWESHTDFQRSEDCAVCQHFPLVGRHIVGMLGFDTVGAISQLVGGVKVHHDNESWIFPISPTTDPEALAKKIVTQFAKLILLLRRREYA